jgi:3-phenylpropionate/trans-cinnamate dioxygenase ferredoxin reductase subunit
MVHYQYMIVGGGMTADSAARGIRNVDPKGPIGMISMESDLPYNRPPLSKKLWQGKPVDSIWRKTESLGVELHLGLKVESIDPGVMSLRDDQGTVYTYDKLLLAMGGTPRHLPFGGDQIIYYRTLGDYQRLRQLTEQAMRFIVIGGGFIGSEIAAALAMNGKEVAMVFPDEGIGARIYPHDLSQYLNHFYRDKGVEVLAGDTVQGFQSRSSQLIIKLGSDRELQAEGVIAGIGIQPNVELAEQADLKVDNGIVVDEFLQTSHAGIYAAGDVASFYNPALGVRMRVEHEDNANTMGMNAGQNMAGDQKPYHHLPFFFSDLFELGYEAVGELNSQLEMVADWQEPYQKGVVYYLKNGRVRGVLLWNVWEQVEAARKLIAEPGPFNAKELKGRLPT